MKRRGKAAPAAAPEPVPEGHASDLELFDLECQAWDGSRAPFPPVGSAYIRARRAIYNLGREHGRREAKGE